MTWVKCKKHQNNQVRMNSIVSIQYCTSIPRKNDLPREHAAAPWDNLRPWATRREAWSDRYTGSQLLYSTIHKLMQQPDSNEHKNFYSAINLKHKPSLKIYHTLIGLAKQPLKLHEHLKLYNICGTVIHSWVKRILEISRLNQLFKKISNWFTCPRTYVIKSSYFCHISYVTDAVCPTVSINC